MIVASRSCRRGRELTAKLLMVQGTGSSVGKSLLATAFCRIFRQDGYTVAPFKAQNMSLNSFVTPDGAEIGRAQAVQAEAAEVLPRADMNPVLLKPEVDYRSQLVVMGKPAGSLESSDFYRRKEWLWEVVAGAMDRLTAEFDVIVIEGAGSPAEINLREGDIVNMEVALHAHAPVLLVGDIDRGGVFASLYGTVSLLAPRERELVRGVIINKFRGDLSILEPGLRQLEELTGVPEIGTVPYFRDIHIPEEDSPAAETPGPPTTTLIDVAVILLPHIANFDDFDPLRREEGVAVRYVRREQDIGSPDLIIVPGTKTTMSDLEYLRDTGVASRIVALADEGTPIIGICGGFQMLGRRLLDPERVESSQERMAGLGLLPVKTSFSQLKETHQVSGEVSSEHGLLKMAKGLPVEGYEIHMGNTVKDESETDTLGMAPFRLISRSGRQVRADDGCMSSQGWVLGTYIHGLFNNGELRRSILQQVAARKGVILPMEESLFSQSQEYDKLAALVRRSLDMDAIYRITGFARS